MLNWLLAAGLAPAHAAAGVLRRGGLEPPKG